MSLVVSDGDGGSQSAAVSTVVTGTTTNSPPTVAITTPEDARVTTSALFTFVATDTDAAQANGPFIFTIDWGDGSTQTATSSGRTLTLAHTYSAVSATGVYTIAATAKENAAATPGPLATSEFVVFGWSILADPVNPGEAMLVVVGTQGSDEIKINERCGDYFRIKLRDRDDNIRYRGTVYGDVDRVLVFAHAGDDRITIDDDIDVGAEIWGGRGNDELKGGEMHDIIFGEEGDDKIYGGPGRDILIGGLGADRIHGDEQDDIIIAGYTAFERTFNELAPSIFPASSRLTLNQQREAIEAIMAEWTSARSYSQRVANIRGAGSGTRANGTNYFRYDAVDVTQVTVFDDNVKDILWGDSGNDWFLSNSDGATSTRDELRDRSNSESQNDLDRWW